MFLINEFTTINEFTITKLNLKSVSKYGFCPDLGIKNSGVLSMRMQVILDSSFRPPWFSPYMGQEERRVQGLD